MKFCKNKYYVYDSCFSPQQQPDDEKNAPAAIAVASGFPSNGKSIPRELRKERGYGELVFKKDLSECYVHIEIENLKSSNIKKIHIHAGAPGILGPIIVNLGALINIEKDLAKGCVIIPIKNKDIADFTLGESNSKSTKSKHPECEKYNSILPKPYKVDGIPLTSGNIATLDSLARQGLIYFNFHNDAENFYGIMRGQIYPTTEKC